MACYAFLGTWEILGYGHINGAHGENNTLEGVRFRLDETGDITWTIPEELKSIPLFSCDTYEIYNNTVLRFGAYAGHVIEFRADSREPKDSMVLKSEGWCILRCRRVNDEPIEQCVSAPFTLLPALEDGYFSDIKIIASNSKVFHVHMCILQLYGGDIPWQTQPPPFTGLPENVLGTILHFLYTECLPDNMDKHTAEQVISAATPYVCLLKLVNMCQLYLKNMALKQQIIGLVNDMHTSINQIIEYFSVKNLHSTFDNITSNPAKLCFVVKQSVRDTAVVVVKLLLLCDIFTKREGELTREERNEIICYAKSRLPIFLSQLHKFLQVLKSTFSSMTSSQRHEVATYLVPEIELTLDTASLLIVEIEKASEQILQVISPHGSGKCKSGVGDILWNSLSNILHIRDLTKLRDTHEHIALSLGVLLEKKENFNQLSSAQKIRTVSRNLEYLVDELPIFLLHLKEFSAALEEKVEWRDFKFCFKIGISEVSGMLQHLVDHQDKLQDLMVQITELVQRDAFTQSLHCLGLLDLASASTFTSDSKNDSKSATYAQSKQNQSGCKSDTLQQLVTDQEKFQDAMVQVSESSQRDISQSLHNVDLLELNSSNKRSRDSQNDLKNSLFAISKHQSGCKLNLMESFCTPPTSANSALSKFSLELLKSGVGTDMEFEVIGNSSSEHEDSDINVEDEHSIICAHRVIVAARCDWFRRALLSGMREAIEKKIVVHDTNPFLFMIFLEYLYSGRLHQAALTTEQLSELLLLSDRYEVDSLKQTCEYALQASVDQESVLYFLSMADQFNARILRNACLNFISKHHELMESEVYFELPIALQTEIFDYAWTQPPPRKSGTIEHSLPTSSTPPSADSSLSDVQKGLTGFHISSQQGHSNSSSLDELPLSYDTDRLDACLLELRNILGDTASRDILIQVILAADFDLCRAINYFYARNNGEE